jgi:TldD protein
MSADPMAPPSSRAAPASPAAPELPSLDAALLRRLASRLVRRPGEYGDLFLEASAVVELHRESDGGIAVTAGVDRGAAARVLLPDGSVRHVACSGLDPEGIEALPQRLAGAESRRAPDGAAAPAAPPGEPTPSGSGRPRRPAPRGRAASEAGAPALRAYLDEIERALGAAAHGTSWGQAWLASLRPAAIRERAGSRAQRVLIATSEGEIVEDRRDWIWFTLRVLTPGAPGRAPFRAAAGGGARDLERLRVLHPPAEVAARLAADLEASGAPAPAPSGTLPVILGPGGGGILFHEACGHALEADRALSGRSALAQRFGDAVGPEALTLVDDPTLDGLAGSRRFDDEGWRTAATVLIEAGRISGLLLDRGTARRVASAPTGSARRESWRDLPLPRMTNTFVREGSSTPADIVSQVSRGLYVAELGAGRVDTASGEFEFQVRRGTLVAAGRLVAPVGPCVVAGNGLQALSGVRAVGTDLRFDPGAGECGKDGQRARAAVGQPTVLVEALSVRPVEEGL